MYSSRFFSAAHANGTKVAVEPRLAFVNEVGSQHAAYMHFRISRSTKRMRKEACCISSPSARTSHDKLLLMHAGQAQADGCIISLLANAGTLRRRLAERTVQQAHHMRRLDAFS